MRFRFDNALFSLAFVAVPANAEADDWIATKLRGAVYSLQNGQWAQLHRADIVSDSRIIRTGPDGAAQFARDAETVDMGANTQIRIFDRAGRRFTTVNESFGTVAIEANVRNVRHFAVQTPFIAAVVKGTKFEVKSGQANTRVDVVRGRVRVEDFSSQNSVDVLVNQHAIAGANQPLSVAGAGRLQPIKNRYGQIVAAPEETAYSGLSPVTAAFSSADSASEAPSRSNSGGSTASSHSPASTPTPTPTATTPTPTPTRTPCPTSGRTPDPKTSPEGDGGHGEHKGWWRGTGNPHGR